MWLVDDEVITRWGLSIFIIFISFIWHPWLMTKWCGHPIIITMLRKWLQVIWYEHRQPYPPTNLCTYLFTYPPTHPTTYYLTSHTHTHPRWPTYLPTYLTTHPLTHPLIYLPTHPPTSYLSFYNLLPIS